MDPMPPTHAPTERAQASGSVGMPSSPDERRVARIATMVVVYGKDSRKAEPMADTHRKTRQAMATRCSSSCTERMILVKSEPIQRIRPSSARSSTKMNRAAKKMRVSHSTASSRWRM
eukprot:scaffold254083_cov32-Tisochrysis_lutea.AAC.2